MNIGVYDDVIETIQTVFDNHLQEAIVGINDKGKPFCKYYDDGMTRSGLNLFDWMNEFITGYECCDEDQMIQINEYSKKFTKDGQGAFDWLVG